MTRSPRRIPVVPVLVAAAALVAGTAVGVVASGGEGRGGPVPAVELSRDAPDSGRSATPVPESPAPDLREEPASPTMGGGARVVPPLPVPVPAPPDGPVGAAGDDDGPEDDADDADDQADDDGTGDDDGGGD